MEYELSHHAAARIAERKIELLWVESTLKEPDLIEADPIDPLVRHALKRIASQDNRVLRVVYNTAVTPPRVISAFFDRRMKDML